MKKKKDKGIAPAITLLIMAPLIAEVLPGATRFSSLFVFPIEMLVWGGGALLIRHVVRKNDLGWISMLLLGLALSIAEELLIQQTSIAPLVIKLKGVTYARAWGVNYVYLLWALIYETVFVVFLPIHLTEMIFPSRSKDSWLGKWGVLTFSFLFVLGGFAAWFTWTQIARVKVFHVPAYNPSIIDIIIAVVFICCLVFMATRVSTRMHPKAIRPFITPSPWIVAIIGAVWAVLLYGLLLLAFGIMPSFPSLAAVGGGLILAAILLWLLPRWIASSQWQKMHVFSVIFGTISGSMLIGFIGFTGGARADLYFKIIINILAFIFLIRIGMSVKNRSDIPPIREYIN